LTLYPDNQWMIAKGCFILYNLQLQH